MRCIFILDEWYKVSTLLGLVPAGPRAPTEDYLAGKLWITWMNRENGLRVVRNLGAKSEAEITRCFFDACYQLLTPGEQAIYWQRVLDGQGGGEET